MVASPLVESEIRAGKHLLEALDQLQADVRAALWSYTPEASEWRLVLALPIVDRLGPEAAYRIVQRALLVAAVRIPLRRISVVGLRDPIVLRFGGYVSKGNRAAVEGLEFDDAYLYR